MNEASFFSWLSLSAWSDSAIDPWLLAVGTMMGLAAVGLWWRQQQVNKSGDTATAEPSSGWSRPDWSLSAEAVVSAGSVGEVQDRLSIQLLKARTLVQTSASLPGSARLQQLDWQLAQALLSLRLMRDAMRTEPSSLSEGLLGMQTHFQPLLAERGIRLAWLVCPQVLHTPLSARRRLQLLRIIQEALDNVLVHAHGASQAVLSCDIEEHQSTRHLVLRVRDDGDGRDHAALVRGDTGVSAMAGLSSGLTRLERQAHEMGASLAIGSVNQNAHSGWAVELSLPLV